MNDRVHIVLVTAPPTKAGSLAKKILGERLAACVSVLPAVMSHYRWQGRVHSDRESLLVIKTTRRLWKPLVAFIKARHPYEVPEILSLPVLDGDRPYLDWVLANCA